MDSKAKQRRSRKVCENCHVRKLRCNVEDIGSPCSNCVTYRASCVLRKRKNRRESLLSEHARRRSPPVSVAQASPAHGAMEVLGPFARSPSDDRDSTGPMTVESFDYNHMLDLDDVFTFTGNSSSMPLAASHSFSANAPPSPHPGAFATFAHLCKDDLTFLREQGCLDLPQKGVFRELMLLYFKFVHPNLPIVPQELFWSRWHGDEFVLGTFSLLLVRAMIYAASGYANASLLSALGFENRREARNASYRKAKLVFDFEADRDPISNAQSCLLLTYETSTMQLRINSSWLAHAIRFARMARAESYYRYQTSDNQGAKLLKRLWWGIVFRDRILSLGLRRKLQVEIDPTWEDAHGRLKEEYALSAADFDSELGVSPVHSLETQLRLAQLVNLTCHLMPGLSGALGILYHHESLDDRLEAASRSLVSSINNLHRAVAELGRWQESALQIFPSPISLDDSDVDEAISIYANMLFVYQASAVFALQSQLIFIHELVPASRSLIDEDTIEESVEALEDANADIMRRIKELIQTRLLDSLPVSIVPLVGPPLLLQAINLAAVRGTHLEATESRKLDIFTRTLESCRERFRGSEFVFDLLMNMIGYAQDDEKFMSAMSNWRRSSKDVDYSTSGHTRIKLDWSNLVCQRPKLFLRLMVHMDLAFCTGHPPDESDLPEGLRKQAA
ncbi:hypothetical protein CB0940_02594 [Cercospora beticola]|uniref:Zn(2)-C6 fungal-type domain-containing protein n=1 Tax=Cercospora beticola TaxID=122368 RepID=A0A2G5I5X6_CERBT|nr:hypothetical protein CB0940_02594 [Cercospora beticola]PIB00159.1 hypothetical protein CB0940_02594 [Cercospora beticola]WPA99738.1 hypothetical protein RHO25_004357 [Cercospora beticola]CAK1362111.1 unnamed protein product [Cercospora beticola]